MSLKLSYISFLTVLVSICSMQTGRAQLGLCEGASGEILYSETFGSGTDFGPELPPGTTTYEYVAGEPNDGDYTISSNTTFYDWFDLEDRTDGDTNGNILLVNADSIPGQFYRTDIGNLCGNTSYEFSSWLINLQPITGCGGEGLPVNIEFQIWDSTDTELLASGTTGDIEPTMEADWKRVGLVFLTLPDQTGIVVKLFSVGIGGCANDFGMDEFQVRSCGDAVAVVDESGLTAKANCEDPESAGRLLSIASDFSVYATPVYQWQRSTDGISWDDIPGETGTFYERPVSEVSMFYRVKIAENVADLARGSCGVFSEIFEVIVEPPPDPPVSAGDVVVCPDDPELLTVTVPDGVRVEWYAEVEGGSPIAENTLEFSPDMPGTYYAEAISIKTECRSESRSAIAFSYSELLDVEDETLFFCIGDEPILSAGIEKVDYLWNTGEITQDIQITMEGEYSVILTDSSGCTVIKTITAIEIEPPVIEDIRSDGPDIVVTTRDSGDFEYSLGDGIFQDSPIFELTETGTYIITVRDKYDCGEDSREYVHVRIPKFFTPNGDSVNDNFIVDNLSSFDSYRMHIFDRFGKHLKSDAEAPLTWDGTYGNKRLPSSDYWYHIVIDSRTFKGHFTLKR